MNRRVERGIWFLPAVPIAMVVIIVVGVVLLAILVAASVAAYKGRMVDGIKEIPADACPCTSDPEREEMENRLAEVEALAKKNLELASDPSAGKPYSDSQKESNAKQLSEAVGAKEVNKIGGTEGNCDTWTSEKKPTCIRWGLQVHENVHSAACQKYVKGGGKGNWKSAYTQGDYSREDAAAYQAEIAFLKSKLANCRKHSTYLGPETKEQQQQRYAGSKRRVAKSVGAPI